MSKLENLVPDLELCKRIPKGAFADSALVWTSDQSVWVRNWDSEIPAPTLQEILAEMSDSTLYYDGRGRWTIKVILPVCVYEDSNAKPANVALKLWLIQSGMSDQSDQSGLSEEATPFDDLPESSVRSVKSVSPPKSMTNADKIRKMTDDELATLLWINAGQYPLESFEYWIEWLKRKGEKMTEFEQLVLEMRTAQKNFFRYHDQNDLRKSKELERKVDAELARKQELEKDPMPDLFGGETK